jgi:hypothetical protein
MNNSRQATLALGGTGRTGSLVASKLADFARRNAHAWALPAAHP